ncbi:hypothetical protein F2P81_024661 [Scophthalmus maximus]|uniref:Allantoate amidinohydrolase n=1 Tax=Scophthalmus maximus TaxID=52904 RepID=A0A6A4RYB4_SCOMX|nr:hypothetical protein F2P81_024661 [Scophthalmus maximus]
MAAKASAETDFLQFNDLACETVGGRVIFATDEWFAPAANLLKRETPQFIADAFTDFGKWMDGWETRRKRTADDPPTFSLEGDRTGMAASGTQLAAVAKVDQRGILQVPGEEWAVFRLGRPGVVSSVEVDTNHFKGNFPDSCRVEACTLTPEDEVRCVGTRWRSGTWQMLLPPQKLRPHHRHLYGEAVLAPPRAVSHVRLIIAPDGGVSRLRLWGRPVPITAAPTNQQPPASKL